MIFKYNHHKRKPGRNRAFSTFRNNRVILRWGRDPRDRGHPSKTEEDHQREW